MNQYCYVKLVLLIESIFVGKVMSLQIQVNEAYIKPMKKRKRVC